MILIFAFKGYIWLMHSFEKPVMEDGYELHAIASREIISAMTSDW